VSNHIIAISVTYPSASISMFIVGTRKKEKDSGKIKAYIWTKESIINH